MFQRIKNWIIKKLGGWTEKQYRMLAEQYRTQAIMCDNASTKNHVLARTNEDLVKKLQDCRDTLAGLEILKTKIDTFRATAKVLKLDRTEKQIRKEIEVKKAQATTSLISDLFMRDRFVVINVQDKGNHYEVTATVSVLEGGVINEETQLIRGAVAACRRIETGYLISP